MKALLLSAGFGTRLLPYTRHTPKPLFPVGGIPLIDRSIQQLADAGFREVVVNTHYLHERIEAHLNCGTYPISVHTRFEPAILGTGGAIRNTADFWDSGPFLVMNSDIVTDIDLKTVFRSHCDHPWPVTLVLVDREPFNLVSASKAGFVVDFHAETVPPEAVQLAFTGIQVIDPEVIGGIPENSFYSSIDLYRKLILEGRKIAAFTPKDIQWQDVGTPESYRDVDLRLSAPKAFEQAFGIAPAGPVAIHELAGDGSDRKWYRLHSGAASLVMADHGIRKETGITEVDSFLYIGNLLQSLGIPVPRIFLGDPFSGLVFLEDLGDTHLQRIVRGHTDAGQTLTLYRRIIDSLMDLSIRAGKDFESKNAYQSAVYDRELILEKECRYFGEAFLQGFLGLEVDMAYLADDFEQLADSALRGACMGFMHRDMQSRNIMIKDGRHFFIDFQGGRIGPLQYDLASLLIDPYVALPFEIQMHLLGYCSSRIASRSVCGENAFESCFFACALTRNLQILGAFGHLSRVKGKTDFENYIPQALATLRAYLSKTDPEDYPDLKAIVGKAEEAYSQTCGKQLHDTAKNERKK